MLIPWRVLFAYCYFVILPVECTVIVENLLHSPSALVLRYVAWNWNICMIIYDMINDICSQVAICKSILS